MFQVFQVANADVGVQAGAAFPAVGAQGLDLRIAGQRAAFRKLVAQVTVLLFPPFDDMDPGNDNFFISGLNGGA